MMNLTEPQAGSDLSKVQTRATPEGDRYRLRGTKTYITWGDHDMAENIVHLVLARIDGARPGPRGLLLFLMPRLMPAGGQGRAMLRNDVVRASLEHKLGIHASPTAVMRFGEVTGAIGFPVGEAGAGLECMFTIMNNARLNVGLEGVALSDRAYQAALAYARLRVQGRPAGADASVELPIVHHPDVKRMLLDMEVRTHAMRALCYEAAACIDRARHVPCEDRRERARCRADLLTPTVKGRARRARSASRSTAGWGTSRRRESPSTSATPASQPSTRGRPPSRPTTGVSKTWGATPRAGLPGGRSVRPAPQP